MEKLKLQVLKEKELFLKYSYKKTFESDLQKSFYRDTILKIRKIGGEKCF